MDRAEYLDGLVAFFRRYYQGLPDSAKSKLVNDSLQYVEPVLGFDSGPNTIVSIEQPDCKWHVYADVLRKYSNLFRRKLAGGFAAYMLDRGVMRIKLPSADPAILHFVILWMYFGWDKAVVQNYAAPKWGAPFLKCPVNPIAQVLVLGNMLEMPLLCYEARWRMILSLSGFIAFYRVDNLRGSEMMYLEAADVLQDSGVPRDAELAQMIRDLFRRLILEDVSTVDKASEVFMRIFPEEDHWLLKTTRKVNHLYNTLREK